MPAIGQIILYEDIEIGAELLLRGDNFTSLMSWQTRILDAITVRDALKYFRARVNSIDMQKGEARLTPFETLGEFSGETPEILLLQSLPEKERFELIIQKTTELGVNSIMPFKSDRSTSLEERESAQKKAHRWVSVALRAARQARLPHIPSILPYGGFNEALDLAGPYEAKIILYEAHGAAPLKDVMAEVIKRRPRSIALLTGPEGGFTVTEMDAAVGRGFTPVSLGRNILRAETAAIVGVAILRYETGC